MHCCRWVPCEQLSLHVRLRDPGQRYWCASWWNSQGCEGSAIAMLLKRYILEDLIHEKIRDHITTCRSRAGPRVTCPSLLRPKWIALLSSVVTKATLGLPWCHVVLLIPPVHCSALPSWNAAGVDMNTSKLVEGGAGPETTQTLKDPWVESDEKNNETIWAKLIVWSKESTLNKISLAVGILAIVCEKQSHSQDIKAAVEASGTGMQQQKPMHFRIFDVSM